MCPTAVGLWGVNKRGGAGGKEREEEEEEEEDTRGIREDERKQGEGKRVCCWREKYTYK